MKNLILNLTLATAAIVPSLPSYAYDRGASRYAGYEDEDDLDAELDDLDEEEEEPRARRRAPAASDATCRGPAIASRTTASSGTPPCASPRSARAS